MDLDLDAATLAFRDEVREWLATHVPTRPLPSFDTAEGFAAHREWESTLASARLSAVTWPEVYGGRDASLVAWLVFEEEYYAARAPGRVNQNGIAMLGPTLFAHGTGEQRERILPPMTAGAQIWAQAWSEPDAGSDIAALRSRARRVDGGWSVSGQKTWSSRAAFADRAFGLFRTDPEARRHRGLSYLMVDLRAPGVTVRPIPQLDGETGFAEIFFDEVFVPDADVIGEPGDGWRVAMTTANNERGMSLRSPGRFLATARRLTELWRSSPRRDDTALAQRVADAWIGARAYQLHTYATASRLAAGGTLGPESSVGKLHWSRLDLQMHETALDLLGPEPSAEWTDGWLFALAGPIYGGTDQIQRNTVAERLLGLPR
ncbi:acyl-CoA dehydrogenase family protein [Amycolatopsis suaedae]|uniref:Acyl-CoA dehydrogenase n=1 Tax=Amycolatopsis suaedae TaxID=2510978 RepID=A0A4V2ELY0_9PSEU|nr:acyl-CoA dehydrogenase family protein [Amycolatopsis suaedae]RZQ63135.1 acyl-CoA dehydrogenase [Amycolatopsis suaedae]